MKETELSDLKKANSDLKEENKALLKKIAALEKANNIDFLDNLSHEIRTPIQAINAVSKGLVTHWDEFDEDTSFKLASKIANNSQRLFSLVDNILEAPNIKEGKVDLKYSRVLIEDLIEELVADFELYYLDNKDVDIQIVSKIKDDTILLADKDKITQIIRNLLTNALKVCKIGKIIVQISYEEDFVQISVIDEGIGIPDKEIKYLFNKEGKTSNTRQHTTGVGIGLMVCKCLVEAHQGKIWAENNKGPGARISFTLPIPNFYKKKMLERENQKSNPESTQRVRQPSAESLKDVETPKANIVVIDDEDACLLSISMMLMKTNYELKLYNNPLEALDFLKMSPNSPDLILLDVMMPEMDGINVLKNIKSSTKLKSLPILMQSGVADKNQMKQAINLGANEFIRKPYSKDALLESIEKHLPH